MGREASLSPPRGRGGFLASLGKIRCLSQLGEVGGTAPAPGRLVLTVVLASASLLLASPPRLIRVAGDQEWVRTGIYLRAGESMVLYASGEITYSAQGRRATPKGASPGFFLPLGDRGVGALIGRIGDHTFYVGEELWGEAPASGELLLGINDNRLDDNGGLFEVLVMVRGARPAGAPAPRRPSGFRPPDDPRYFHWKGRVDGLDDIVIRGRTVEVRHREARLIQSQDYHFGSSLPSEAASLDLQVLQGRGRVRIIQEPSRENQWTAVVRLDDTRKKGADEYEFLLTWRSVPSRRKRSGWWKPRARGSESIDYFQWQGRVDGIDDIRIRGEEVTISHREARPVEDPRYRLSAPLPRRFTDVELRQVRGRGSVRWIERPSRSNDYTAVIRVDDSVKGGAREYAFELVWSASPAEREEAGYATFRWKGRVDIGARIVIRGGRARVENLGGAPTRVVRSLFSQPLPARALAVSLKKLRGRGSVELVAMPSAANRFAAVVEIRDPKGGSGRYEFELRWRP